MVLQSGTGHACLGGWAWVAGWPCRGAGAQGHSENTRGGGGLWHAGHKVRAGPRPPPQQQQALTCRGWRAGWGLVVVGCVERQRSCLGGGG